MSLLIEQFQAYDQWRGNAARSLKAFVHWLKDRHVQPAALQSRLSRMLERLSDDRLTIAFVGEVSRGKSELINALFFAEAGRRILPSSAGRTTMCPTEFFWDLSKPQGVWLLPIGTRLDDRGLLEYKENIAAWQFVSMDANDAQSMASAMSAVRETRWAELDEARELGLWDDRQVDGLTPESERIEIPVWRHALVNLPHPLLKAGLTLLDTPGMNALGVEPDLTLGLIPGAHAVVTVFSADTGLTRSDATLWRQQVCSVTAPSGRWVVLNKIDGLWDPLRPGAEVEAEIERQRLNVADKLRIASDQVFALSARAGLIAKIQGDSVGLSRSQLLCFEKGLSEALLPRKREIVANQLEQELSHVSEMLKTPILARQKALADSLIDLDSLRGKSGQRAEQLEARLCTEREAFDTSIRHLMAVRAVVARQAQSLFQALAVDGLRRNVRAARESLLAKPETTQTLREALDALLASVGQDLVRAQHESREIVALTEAVFRGFSTQHGMVLPSPTVFNMRTHFDEIDKIGHAIEQHFDARSTQSVGGAGMTRRFIETVANRLKLVLETATQEAETWVRSILLPVESQMAEHKIQLRRRLDAVRRIGDASQSLEQRVADIRAAISKVERELQETEQYIHQLRREIQSSPAVMLSKPQ